MTRSRTVAVAAVSAAVASTLTTSVIVARRILTLTGSRSAILRLMDWLTEAKPESSKVTV